MSCTGLDHINIECLERDYDSVLDFYCNLLGLVNGDRPTMTHRGAWLYAGEEAIIHLSVREQVKSGGSAINHFALSYVDVEAMREKLQNYGVSYQERVVSNGLMTQLFIIDPLANRVELNFRSK